MQQTSSHTSRNAWREWGQPEREKKTMVPAGVRIAREREENNNYDALGKAQRKKRKHQGVSFL